MAIKVFKRYEKKYLMNKNKMHLLINDLLKYMNFDAFCDNGKTYTVMNIYYDTIDNNIIRQSVMKPYFKEKLRLRKYLGSSNEFLEIKRKTGNIVSKRRITLEKDEANNLIEHGIKPTYCDYMQNQVINEIAFFLKCNKVYPKAFISYNRIALFGKDNSDFRVTFDTYIKGRTNKLDFDDGIFGRDLISDDDCLMEVKIDGSIPFWFSNLLSKYQIYPTSFSKYGMEYKYEIKEMKKYA